MPSITKVGHSVECVFGVRSARSSAAVCGVGIDIGIGHGSRVGGRDVVVTGVVVDFVCDGVGKLITFDGAEETTVVVGC